MASSILFPSGSAGLPALFGGAAPVAAPASMPAASPVAVSSVPAPATATPSSWDVLGHMVQGKSLPDAYAAAQSQAQPPAPASDPYGLPPIPTENTHTNPITDFLDREFLGGAYANRRDKAFAVEQAMYQNAMAQLSARRMFTAQDALTPTARALSIISPDKFTEKAAEQFAPQNVAGGNTLMMQPLMAGTSATASTAPLLGFDAISGRNTVSTPDGTTAGPTLGGGISTDANGNVISSRTGPTGENLPTFQKVGAGETGDFLAAGGGSGPPASAPMLGSGGTPVAGARGARNNNLTNVKALPGNAKWKGQIGTDPDGYAIFPQGAEGAALSQRAAMRNMASYARKDGVKTITQYADRWNPGASAAVRSNYINTLSSALGVGPNDPVDLTDPQVQQKLYKAQVPLETPVRGGGSATASAAPTQGRFKSSLQGKTFTVDPTTGIQTAPTGETSLAPGAWTPSNALELRNSTVKSEQFTDYSTARGAYDSLVKLAQQPPGGIRAYAARDLAARVFNPGAVTRQGTVEALHSAQGVPQNIRAYFDNLKGDGDVPPAIMQQLVNAAHPFAVDHYNQIKAVNDAAATVAKHHRLDPADVTAPIGNMPQRYDMTAHRFVGGNNPADILADAKSAVARGAPKAAVAARLQKMGIDPRGL